MGQGFKLSLKMIGCNKGVRNSKLFFYHFNILILQINFKN